jgi:MoaA/NifB/PqqE/SkfB family radical SAM enzyme
MRRLDLKVGFDCNSRCRFCVQGDKRFIYGSKSSEELKKLMEENACRGLREIVFTGGECTIRNDLLELVKHAKQLGYTTIQIQSNGRRFFYPEYCKAIIAAGATEFAISLHGSTAEMHDSLTQAKGSFVQVTQGIRNLRALKQRVMTNTVIVKQNYKELPAIARLLVELDVDQFQLAFVHILGTADKNKLEVVPRKTEVMPYVREALNIGIKAGKKVMTEAIPYCFMQGYEQYVAERIIPVTRVEDATWAVENFTEWRRNEGKVKCPACRECAYHELCEGPWREYPELFGWEEFIPVKGELPAVMKQALS